MTWIIIGIFVLGLALTAGTHAELRSRVPTREPKWSRIAFWALLSPGVAILMFGVLDITTGALK